MARSISRPAVNSTGSTLLSSRLKELRISKKMSQQALGDVVSVSRAAISLFELGASRPSSETLSKLADALKVDMEYLLGKSQVLVATGGSPSDMSAFAKQHGLNQAAILAQVLPDRLSVKPINRFTIDEIGGTLMLRVSKEGRSEYIERAVGERQLDAASTVRGTEDGTRRLFEAVGNNMAPALQEGEWIVGSYISDLVAIETGRLYVIVVADGIHIGRITNLVSTRKVLVINSDNPAYPQDAILEEDVLEVWAFEMKLTSHI